MTDFNDKQIKLLRGQYKTIAESCGVTGQYAAMIISGKREKKSKKAQDVARKAKLILEILEN